MIVHKRGSTFDYIFEIPSSYADNYFDGWTITAYVKTIKDKVLISNITSNWRDSITRVLQLVELDTSGWEVGDADMDIRFQRESDGYTLMTSTERIRIIDSITQEESA